MNLQTTTEITKSDIDEIRSIYANVLEKNATALNLFNRQKSKRIVQRKVTRIILFTLGIILTFLLLVGHLPYKTIHWTPDGSDHDHFVNVIFIIVTFVFVFGGQKITKKIFDIFNQRLSKLHSKSTFLDLDTVIFPFVAGYQLEGTTITYTRKTDESKKEIWSREVKADFYDVQEKFIVIYDSNYGIYPYMFIFSKEHQQDIIDEFVKKNQEIKPISNLY